MLTGQRNFLSLVSKSRLIRAVTVSTCLRPRTGGISSFISLCVIISPATVASSGSFLDKLSSTESVTIVRISSSNPCFMSSSKGFINWANCIVTCEHHTTTWITYLYHNIHKEIEWYLHLGLTSADEAGTPEPSPSCNMGTSNSCGVHREVEW